MGDTQDFEIEIDREFAERGPEETEEVESTVTPSAPDRPEELDFANVIQEFHDPKRIFSAVAQFQAICQHRGEELQRGVPSLLVAPSLQMLKLQQDAALLLAERNTWLLFEALYRDRTAPRPNLPAPSPALALLTSQQQIINDLAARNTHFREAEIEVRWLETVASMEGPVPTCPVTADWHTARTLLARKAQADDISTGPRPDWTADWPYVTELDPDAPLRQSKNLPKDDQEVEDHFLRVLWLLVRAGRLHDAQDLCVNCGQFWRAASFSGHLSKRPLHLTDEGDGLHADPYHLWKATCVKLSNQEALNMYERAIYATLGGNLAQMLPVCSTWEDHLWARLKFLLHSSINQELENHQPKGWEGGPSRVASSGASSSASIGPHQRDDQRAGSRPSSPDRTGKVRAQPPTALPIQDEPVFTPFALDTIFEDLLKSDNIQVRRAANEPYHIVQTLLILDKRAELMDRLSEWVQWRDQDRRCPPQLIRFAAHIALAFRTLHGVCPRSDEVLAVYVDHLIQTNQRGLVALYTSKLGVGEQVATYSAFLQRIDQRHERERCLELAERAGLDVNRITKHVVELIRLTSPDEAEVQEGALPQPGRAGLLQPSQALTSDEENKIRAIEWLTFDPEQRAEAFFQSNALARKFIALNKFVAVQKLLQALPSDSVRIVRRKWLHDKVSASTLSQPSSPINERRLLFILSHNKRWKQSGNTCL
jgi:nuclear pore complex protein Nup107